MVLLVNLTPWLIHCLPVVQAAQQRGGSADTAVEWSTFEVAAEAAVAAERARRRAVGPGANIPSQGPGPDNPLHPFVAAQNAAREAAAIVTLPEAKRDRASPPPVANPFAAAAGSRGASPRRVLVAEAGGCGFVSPADVPQARSESAYAPGMKLRHDSVLSMEQAIRSVVQDGPVVHPSDAVQFQHAQSLLQAVCEGHLCC